MKHAIPALALAVVATAAGFTTPAAADVDGDVRVGYYTDADDAMVGGGILARVADHWYINPNVELVLVDNGDLFTVNGDVHYDFRLGPDWSWWLGAGPALIFTDPDFGDSDTDLGANALIGIGATRGRVRPFAQGKVILHNDSEAVVSFGIRF